MKNLIYVLTLTLVGCGNSMADHNEALIKNIIDDIRPGWENGVDAAFPKYFLDWDGARYFEGVGQNMGLEDLIVHHVEPEAELGLHLVFTDIQTHLEDNFAWAVIDTDIKLTTKSGRKIHNKGHGTYLFRWINAIWKVVHTQLVSKPVK